MAYYKKKYGRKPYKKSTYKKKLGYKKSYKKKPYSKKTYKRSYKKTQVVNGGTGPRHTMCKHTFAKHSLVPKVFKMLTAPMRYKYNDSDLTYSGTGRQFFADFGQFADNNDLLRIFTAALTQLGMGSPSAATDGDSVYLLNSTAEYLFMNNSLAPMELDIYDYQCIRDTTYTASQMFGFAGGSWTFPVSGSVYPVTSDLPGLNPMESAAFRKAYKVKSWKRVQLNAGQGHKHTVLNTYNKFCSRVMIGEGTFYKGFTSGILIVGKGYPMHSTADTNTAAYAAVRVDASGTVTYNYRWRNPTREHVDYDDNQPIVSTAQQSLINQNGSLVHTGVTFS